MTRAEFQRFAFPGIRENIGLGYRKKATQYTEIGNILDSDAAFEEDHQTIGHGLPQLTVEEQAIPSDRMYDSYSIRYNNADYTLKSGFSHEFIRDMKRPLWNERGRDFGFSFEQAVEVLAADAWWNSAFTNVGYDNVALYSASHPLGARTGGAAGQLQSNVLTTPATLSVGSFRDMLTQLRLFFDPTGVRRIMITAAMLVVPPQLEYVAKEIIKSAGRPDTANRADNVTRDAVRVMVWDYALNAKQWGLLAEKSQHKLKFFWHEKFGTKTYFDEETDTNWVKGRLSHSQGYSDYIGTIATNPS